MIIGNKEFKIKERTHIMGILNVTPDSFSDGGRFNTLSNALEYAEQMIKEGVDIIDIGGESTRPNYTMISEEDEINRVVPVIKELKKHFDIPLSIDTYKSKVAEASLDAGADLINDIWGLKFDANMANVISKYNGATCIMHNRKEAIYDNFMKDMLSDLQDSIDIALAAGIEKDKIIIDPGVGFAKTYEMNLTVVNRLEELQKFELPVLLGTSRKSMIGKALNETVENRLEGTLATSVMGVMKGCNFLRVHDVLANLRAIRMTEAILRER
ncbi:dihydropteroate synthase [Anaerocolumna sp.]|uniref:dihydropteroate synthase n=1 Tax=Anaerocolumna sp. TaxID=2041569 RepID=UPI0028A5C2E7|nr:dihydropteroate synthase [Anaerocolumna sp.]